MTLSKLIRSFEVAYDIGSLGLPGIEEDEIRILLNNAQFKVINHRLYGNHLYQTKYPVEKTIDDLSYITQEVKLNSSNQFVTITSNLNSIKVRYIDTQLILFHIHSVNVVYQNGEEVSQYIDKKFSNSFLQKDSNENIYLRQPKFTYEFKYNNLNVKYVDITLFLDTVKINNFGNEIKVTFIKTPTDLTRSSLDIGETFYDFNDDVYQEIVREAVAEAVMINTPSKTQVEMTRLSRTE